MIYEAERRLSSHTWPIGGNMKLKPRSQYDLSADISFPPTPPPMGTDVVSLLLFPLTSTFEISLISWKHPFILDIIH